MKLIRTNEYKVFLKQLNQARADAGLTQGEVAAKLKRPQSFVSKCELGERIVNVIDLYHFSKIYDKELDYFFPGVE